MNEQPFLKDDDACSSSEGSIDAEETLSESSSRDEVGEVKKLIRKETKGVLVWRGVVLVVMVLVFVVATVATYLVLMEEEKSDFENSYKQYSRSITESSSFNSRFIQDTYQTFADQMTTTAIATGQQWPYVTFPDFQRHGANVRKQTSSSAISVSHKINDLDQKLKWENYTLHNHDWMEGKQPFIPQLFVFQDEEPFIDFDVGIVGPWQVFWEVHPFPLFPLSNFDLGSLEPELYNLDKNGRSIVDKVGIPFFARLVPAESIAAAFPVAEALSPKPNEPHTQYLQPVYDTFDNATKTRAALITAYIRVGVYFNNLLPEGVDGIHVVVDSSLCEEDQTGGKFTWEINGKKAIFLGDQDLHDRAYDKYRTSTSFGNYEDPKSIKEAGGCVFTVNVYPSKDFENASRTKMPIIMTVGVGCIFIFLMMAFFAYDTFQQRRTEKVLDNAAQSNAVVTSLFPGTFRDLMLARSQTNQQSGGSMMETDKNKKEDKNAYLAGASDTHRLKNFFAGDDNGSDQQEHTNRTHNHGGGIVMQTRKPMADLFLETTVMFADIVGFTAWSSVREPSQVFTLLETVYAAFDEIAKRHRVFKVETVGDCYVAVTGLPDPRKDHAIAMLRFAYACRIRVNRIMKQLEVHLGPDTGDLTVRFGVHSGSVTGGVLRGERARFQLFGDTMNMTARMESSCLPNKIQMSKETADLLIAQGKQHWITPRSDTVTIKGKGTVQTYWLVKAGHGGRGSVGSGSSRDGKNELQLDNTTKMTRLIDWQVDVFAKLLQKVICRREAQRKNKRGGSLDRQLSRFGAYDGNGEGDFSLKNGRTCLDEVKEIIELPEFNAEAARNQQDPDGIVLDERVRAQLRGYIVAIAMMYQENAFHNFEHACHVTMSVTKLFYRIVMPKDDVINEGIEQSNIAATLHDHTYGITSDPLTQFAVVFSALIHDVDHTGVPNTKLVTEKPALAKVFREKSVAEQNSIVLSLELLMDEGYSELRNAICESTEEKGRFRQLVFQTVLATDISDKELKTLRNDRWENAFSGGLLEEDPRDTINRKATIVIEHLIQASDVAHTMQHWHVYRRWNENFFDECHKNYVDGRATEDPSEYWYKGEIGFFDFYIIPLAKKLKECGVFGKSSDEYLNYALKNRQEWEERGQEVVAEMVEARTTINGSNHGSLPEVLDDENFEEEPLHTAAELQTISE